MEFALSDHSLRSYLMLHVHFRSNTGMISLPESDKFLEAPNLLHFVTSVQHQQLPASQQRIDFAVFSGTGSQGYSNQQSSVAYPGYNTNYNYNTYSSNS